MAATITTNEEAQAFFERNPDPALRALVDRAVREYGAFMGGLPLNIDAYGDEDSLHTRVYISVVADAAKGSLRGKHHEFMNGWRARHPREELRAVGFSYHYL